MLHTFEYAAFFLLAMLVRLLPLRFVQKLGRWLGKLAYGVLRYRRTETLSNLRLAFPDAPSRWIEEVAGRAYESVVTTFLELLWFPRLSRDSILTLVRCENPEFVETLKARRKGIVFLTAHYGSWELCAQAASLYLGMPINVIVKTQSNRLIDRKVNEFRSRLGNAMIPMQHAVREALTVLREGGCVALAADQSAARESVWTEFFGRPVPTHQGPAVFTLRTGSMLVAAVAERQADGSYRMRFEEIPSSDLAPDDPSSILELTRRHVRWTEEVIRRNPAQWMWMHRRWKHALPGVETGEAA